jgi:hypothetical protein
MQKHFEEIINLLGYIQNERRSRIRRGYSCANVRVMADCENVEEEEEENKKKRRRKEEEKKKKLPLIKGQIYK